MASTSTTQAAQPTSPTDTAAIARLSQTPHIALTLAVTLILNGWQDLSLAVRESLGGPDSADKRDWICGVISDMVAIPESLPPAQLLQQQQQLQIQQQQQQQQQMEMQKQRESDLDLVDDIADRLDDMLLAEFETEVESEDTVVAVAKQIVAIRRRFLSGDEKVAAEVYHQYKAWSARKPDGPGTGSVRVANPDADSSDGDDDDDGDDEDDDDGQPESSGTAGSRAQRQKDEDVDMVDEDGFTMVRRKGRR